MTLELNKSVPLATYVLTKPGHLPVTGPVIVRDLESMPDGMAELLNTPIKSTETTFSVKSPKGSRVTVFGNYGRTGTGYVKGLNGYGFVLGQAYWNNCAANSEGLFPYTFNLPAGNFVNNGGNSFQHTRFVLPMSEYFIGVGAVDIEMTLAQ